MLEEEKDVVDDDLHVDGLGSGSVGSVGGGGHAVSSQSLTEFRQPLQVQSHLEMPRILVQLGHIQRT